MRLILAGTLLLAWVALLPAAALAQATGEVQAIGYNGQYRPNAWTPMIVRLKPETADPGTFEIHVVQHDLDGDRVVYTRKVTLNGNTSTADQRFWMYFLPQPINKGLPDGPSNLHDLQKDLQVYLYSDGGGRQIAELPITSTIANVDPNRDRGGGDTRGTKLILSVSGTGSKQAYLSGLDARAQISGLNQDVEVVTLRMRELPDNPLGYESVDAVLWMDGNPADLEAGNLHQFAALQDYVRFGGHLVVCQPTPVWQDALGFGDMLPVDVTGVSAKADLEPLRSMAAPPNVDADGVDDVNWVYGQPTEAWTRLAPTYLLARSTPRPGAIVERWIDWTPAPSKATTGPTTVPVDRTPYLARRPYGLGAVTWVAQDLSTEATPANLFGWPYVWTSVFGWRTDLYTGSGNVKANDNLAKPLLERYQPGGVIDLGFGFVQNLNLDSKGAWLIVLAIGFFVVYWVVAGPGSYAYLVTARKTGRSWFYFALAALLATAVTVGVVKLVLRGPPQARHVTFVRVAPDQPAVAYTRFGLYIPRDGDQRLELQGTAANQLSFLAPFSEHPQQLGDVAEFPGLQDYDVPVRDPAMTDAPRIDVPYRSSLKKFEARWVGQSQVAFGGYAKLDPDHGRLPLAGKLQNTTGLDLRDVYLAFNVSPGKDWVVYVPSWQKGVTLDVQFDLGKASKVGTGGGLLKVPGDRVVLSDELAPPSSVRDSKLNGWVNYWFGAIRGNGAEGPNTIVGTETSFPMVSLFDRLPPMPNYVVSTGTFGAHQFGTERSDLLDRGVRSINASAAVAAGRLLILATSEGPMTVPVTVDGSAIDDSKGKTFYQFVLPIDRGGEGR